MPPPVEATPPAHARGTTGLILDRFFAVVARRPGTADRVVPLALRLLEGMGAARFMHRGLLANAGRALGTHDPRARRRLARRMLRHFSRFVIDVIANSRATPAQLRARIAWTRGLADYRALRAQGGGVIIATAHFGTFEVAMAALSERERVHVVYHADASGRFETLRSQLRARIGAHEAPVGAGLSTWLALRDALARDEAVVIQADRALPGQRSAVVRFLGGHLRMPTGPLRLAQLSGAPVVPVFARRLPGGRIGIELGAAIRVGSGAQALARTQQRLADAIAARIRAHPQQWLALHPALIEDGG